MISFCSSFVITNIVFKLLSGITLNSWILVLVLFLISTFAAYTPNGIKLTLSSSTADSLIPIKKSPRYPPNYNVLQYYVFTILYQFKAD